MALTVFDVIKQIRSLIDEPSPALASDSDIIAWINEAQRDIARTAECLEATADLAVTSLQQTITAPDDTIRIHDVTYQPTGQTQIYPLRFQTRQQANLIWGTYPSMSSAYPNFYTLWGVSPAAITIQLYPVPSLAGTLNVYYYRMPVDIATFTGNLDIPLGWEDAVVNYCAYIYSMKSKDPKWTDFYKLYTNKLQQLINRTQQYSDAALSIMVDSRNTYYFPDEADY